MATATGLAMSWDEWARARRRWRSGARAERQVSAQQVVAQAAGAVDGSTPSSRR